MAHIVKIDGETILRDDWHTEDIISYGNDMGHDLTEDQAIKIMHLMVNRHDANIGINWDVIDCFIDMFLEMQKNPALILE
jgi:hypothetical protein